MWFGYTEMMTDAVVLLIGTGIFSVIGHGVLMWYRMGKIEGKLEMLCGIVGRHCRDNDRGEAWRSNMGM